MDSAINRLRTTVKQTMQSFTDYVNRSLSDDQVKSDTIFDEDNDKYIVGRWGWDGKSRINVVEIFVRIRDGKVWIEEDWTEDGIATYFLRAGLSRNEIVLGFRHPSLREYTEFAVA